jgi:hypothetical protein
MKCIAAATRWGKATAKPADTHFSVRDLFEEGEPHTQEEKDVLFIGMLRLHIANLIQPLGHLQMVAGSARVATRCTEAAARSAGITDRFNGQQQP